MLHQANQALEEVREFLTKRPIIPTINAWELPITDYRHERDNFLETLYAYRYNSIRCPMCGLHTEQYTWSNIPLEVTEIECKKCNIYYKIERKHDLNFTTYYPEEK